METLFTDFEGYVEVAQRFNNDACLLELHPCTVNLQHEGRTRELCIRMYVIFWNIGHAIALN